MQQRTLGTGGPVVSALGLGCMGVTGAYSVRPDVEAMTALLGGAVDRGVTFFDTAEIYGPACQRGARRRSSAAVP